MSMKSVAWSLKQGELKLRFNNDVKMVFRDPALCADIVARVRELERFWNDKVDALQASLTCGEPIKDTNAKCELQAGHTGKCWGVEL